jgi:dUTP pyrophosphatase
MKPVQFVRLATDVITPVKGTIGAACFDLYSYGMKSEGRGYTVRTGLSIALPTNHVALLYPRSGLATKHGLTLQNGVGVVDEDYRGEIVLKFNRGFDTPDADISAMLQYGHRVAQMMIVELPQVILVEAKELPVTERGGNGFGSTGVS